MHGLRTKTLAAIGERIRVQTSLCISHRRVSAAPPPRPCHQIATTTTSLPPNCNHLQASPIASPPHLHHVPHHDTSNRSSKHLPLCRRCTFITPGNHHQNPLHNAAKIPSPAPRRKPPTMHRI